MFYTTDAFANHEWQRYGSRADTAFVGVIVRQMLLQRTVSRHRCVEDGG